MGRTRTFDVDEALLRAMHTFWRYGYEGTSVADLTRSMGINAPSMYAAFGSKTELFDRVVARYGAQPEAEVRHHLAADTASAGIERLLRCTARRATEPDTPPGCLLVHGALVTGPASTAARDTLGALREATRTAVADRIRQGIEDGDVPAGTDVDAAARAVMLLNHGIAVEAVGGADEQQLQAALDIALAAHPLTHR